MSATMVPDWLLRTLLGGGGLLLVAWLAMGRFAAPARRQRLGEWAVASAMVLALLSLAPAWLIITLPAADSPEPAAPLSPEPAFNARSESIPAADFRADEALPLAVAIPMFAVPPMEEKAAVAEPASSPVEPRRAVEADQAASPQTFSLREGIIRVALTIYAAGGALLLVRWMLGHLILWRLLRRAEPAPVAVARVFQAMTSGCHHPRLLMSRQARVPFSCGLFRPTVVLPAALAEAASSGILPWIFAHELTHLRRRDAWSAVLFGVGQVLYFPLPWFWRLRRQVRLCQEYIADAAAAGLGRPEDYAQFLLSWASSPAAPDSTFAVSGSPSDLFRRITMLLQLSPRVEPRCPRRWSMSIAAGSLTLAVLAAGVGLAVQAAPVPIKKKDASKKDETKKEEIKKSDPKKVNTSKEDEKKDDADKTPDYIEDMIKALPPGTDPKLVEQMREQMKRQFRDMPADQRKYMQQMMRLRPRGGPGVAGFPAAMPPGMQPPGMPQPPGMMPAFGDRRSNARLGARVEKPSATLAEQLDLPKGQGLILQSVSADKAADKAGLKSHDILLELNGKPVPNRVEGFTRLLADIKPDTAVEAVVLRKGKKETIKGLKLPESKEVAPPLPGGFGGFPGQPGLPANMPAPPGALPPGLPGGFGPGDGRGVMTTLFRGNDRFTLRHQEGSLIITLTGKVSDGKAKLGDIHVQDGRESNKYASADKVPEEYRDKVKNLIEMSEKNTVRIEIKTR